jgi:hypothetical protein
MHMGPVWRWSSIIGGMNALHAAGNTRLSELP